TVNWKEAAEKKAFNNLRENVGREWSGRKRIDKLLSWIPFVQLLPIVAALAFYIAYDRSSSNTQLLSFYGSIVIFILSAMVGLILTGLEWLRLRRVSLLIRRIALIGSVCLMLITANELATRVPQRIFLLTLPPEAKQLEQYAAQ